MKLSFIILSLLATCGSIAVAESAHSEELHLSSADVASKVGGAAVRFEGTSQGQLVAGDELVSIGRDILARKLGPKGKRIRAKAAARKKKIAANRAAAKKRANSRRGKKGKKGKGKKGRGKKGRGKKGKGKSKKSRSVKKTFGRSSPASSRTSTASFSKSGGKWTVCIRGDKGYFGTTTKDKDVRKPEGYIIYASGRCEVMEYAGGFDGYFSTDAGDGHEDGLARATKALLRDGSAVVGKKYGRNNPRNARVNAFLKEMLQKSNPVDLDFPRDARIADNGKRKANIRKVSAACTKMIKVQQC